jgi:uncharacterized protein (TIGR00369 family)
MSDKEQKISEEMGLGGEYPPLIDLLGMKFVPLEDDGISIKLPMRNEISLGHGGPLHGGAISAVMDVIGGSVVAWGIRKELADLPLEEQAKRLRRVSTIDLRVDYLRPGKGREFTATGTVIRSGRKVAVARMELHNEEGVLIAVGTGTFTVS